MKSVGVITLLIMVLGQVVEDAPGFAQTLLWAKRAGGVSTDRGNEIAVDSSGNVFVTGSFTGSSTFGLGEASQTTLTAADQRDIFIAKYNSDGTLSWAKRAGGTGSDFGNSISLNNSGDIFVVGGFQDLATFGPGETGQTVLTAAGDSDVFVAKFDSSGSLLWAKRAGGIGEDGSTAVAIDMAGNCYVTGNFSGSATFGSGEANQTVLTAAGTSDVFVANYDSVGLLVWAKRAGGGSFDVGIGVAVDSFGNSYVTGSIEASATFGAGDANQTTLTSAGTSDIFVAKYAPSGELLWAKRAGGMNSDSGNSIAVDNSGNSYVTGFFVGTATFGQGQVNQTVLNGIGSDIFIAKYDSNGVFVWVKRVSGSSAPDFGQNIALDSIGNLYLTGRMSGSATFGPGEANQRTLTSVGDSDVFVAKYNANGALVWATRAGGTGLDEGVSIALDNLRNIYVTGRISGSATFGPGETNQVTLDSAGDIDAFVAKLANCHSGIDFDGDCKSDIGIYRDGLWAIIRSSGGTNIVDSLGGAGHIPVPADYDGDGKADIAVYLASTGVWSIKRSSDGVTTTTGFGGPAFTPVPADYDGDGKADIAVFSGGVWSILRSSDGGNTVVAHGGPSWITVPADYDGDGKADIAVYLDGAWSIIRSTTSSITVVAHGGPPWTPLPADYDGDGKADVAAYLDGAWSILRSSDAGNTVVGHGGPSWEPVPADYDGDGKADIAVHLSGAWASINSTTSSISVVGHGGGPTDVPLN